MKIYVKNKDLGFFTQTPISVTRFEIIDGERTTVWCNHAGAINVPVHHKMYDRATESETEWTTHDALECRTCGATKRSGESMWSDAPEDGVWQ